MNWADIKTNLNCLGSQPPIHFVTTYYFKLQVFKTRKSCITGSCIWEEEGFDIRTNLALHTDSFCLDPSAPLVTSSQAQFLRLWKASSPSFLLRMFLVQAGPVTMRELARDRLLHSHSNVIRGDQAGFDTEGTRTASSEHPYCWDLVFFCFSACLSSN